MSRTLASWRSAEQAAVNCPRCALENRAAASYCGRCGESLGDQHDSWDLLYSGQVDSTPIGQRLYLAVYVGFALLIAVATYARLDGLDRVPKDAHSGETSTFREADKLADGDLIATWSPEAANQPTGFVYWLAPWILLSADSVENVRVSAAIAGFATVGLFFFASRSALGPGPAVLGTGLLGVNQWHLLYSSLTLPVVLVPLFAIGASHYLLRALEGGYPERRRLNHFALAGLLTGLGLYTANSFWILVVAFAFVWFREYLAGRADPSVLGRRLTVFLLPLLVASLPYLVFFFGHGEMMLGAARDASVFESPTYLRASGVADQSRTVLGNIGDTIGTVFWGRETGAAQPVPGRTLGPLTAALAGIGLAVTIWRVRDRRFAFITTMLVVSFVGIGLTSKDGQVERLAVAIPALFMAAAIGFDWLASWLRGRLSPGGIFSVVAAVLAIAAWYNVSSHL